MLHYHESERTKRDFNLLTDALKSTGKSFFISGPLPSLGRGVGLRRLSSHTWLQFTCSLHNIGFIDSFNLFWECGVMANLHLSMILYMFVLFSFLLAFSHNAEREFISFPF